MLLKWMLALGLQGTALITIEPATLASQIAHGLPAQVMNGISGQSSNVANRNSSLLDSGFRSMLVLVLSGSLRRRISRRRVGGN